jgi:hypothetical protein
MEARVKGVLAATIRAEEVTPALLSALQEGLLQALAAEGLLTPAQHRRAVELRRARWAGTGSSPGKPTDPRREEGT